MRSGGILILAAGLLIGVAPSSYAQAPLLRKAPEIEEFVLELLGRTAPRVESEILVRRVARAEAARTAQYQEEVLMSAIKRVPVQFPANSIKFDRAYMDAEVAPLLRESLDDADFGASATKNSSKEAYRQEVKSALSHKASAKAKSSLAYSFDELSGTFSVNFRTGDGDAKVSLNLYKIAAKAAVAHWCEKQSSPAAIYFGVQGWKDPECQERGDRTASSMR